MDLNIAVAVVVCARSGVGLESKVRPDRSLNVLRHSRRHHAVTVGGRTAELLRRALVEAALEGVGSPRCPGAACVAAQTR